MIVEPADRIERRLRRVVAASIATVGVLFIGGGGWLAVAASTPERWAPVASLAACGAVLVVVFGRRVRRGQSAP